MDRTLLAPGICAALLVVVVLAELSVGGAPPAARALRVPVHVASVATIRQTDVAGDAAAIVARPLFSTDRRPAHDTSNAAAANVAPRLSAIFIGGPERRAVFEDGGKPIVAREGGRAGPYTILSIGADRVTVATAEGTRALRPTPIPSDNGGNGQDANGQNQGDAGPAPPVAPGLSLLQQLQRNGAGNINPATAIQNLIARMHPPPRRD